MGISIFNRTPQMIERKTPTKRFLMREPGTKHMRFWVLSLVALSFITLSILFDGMRHNNLYLWARDVSVSIIHACSQPLYWAEHSYSHVQNLWQHVDNLSEIERLERSRLFWEQKTKILQAENKALKQQLKFIDPTPSLLCTSEILMHAGGPEKHEYYIDGGKKQQLAAGQMVTAGSYLLGRIENAGIYHSKIMSIWDQKSRIPISIVGTNEKAIAIGQGSHININLSSDRVSFDDIIEHLVITSGDGGIFPRGIIVGQIRHDNNHGLCIEPFIDPKTVRHVLIYTVRNNAMDWAPQ